MSDAASVSVVIPCRNEQAHIGRLLAAVARQTRPPIDIVIVDAGSTDGTLSAIHEAEPSLAPITVRTLSGRPARVAASINHGVREARGTVIVRLDGHSTPSSDYIERALAQLSDPAVGVVGGIWHVVPGAATSVAAAIARAVSHPLGAGDAAYRTRVGGDPIDVDTVPFGCFTRETWQRVGGLNEHLVGNEEYEFNYHVRRRIGLGVRLDPAMQSTYVARARLPALALQYFRYGWTKAEMLWRYPESLKWRQAVPVALVASLILLGILGIFLRPMAMLLAVTVALYLAVVVGTAAWICVREGGWNRLAGLVGAFTTIHLSWGIGALTYVFTLGRWPHRRFLFGIRAPS